MRRWLNMIAAGQSARWVTLDAGLHALAGLVDFLPRMKQRMAAARLIEDLEYARHGGEALRLDILQHVPRLFASEPFTLTPHKSGQLPTVTQTAWG